MREVNIRRLLATPIWLLSWIVLLPFWRRVVGKNIGAWFAAAGTAVVLLIIGGAAYALVTADRLSEKEVAALLVDAQLRNAASLIDQGKFSEAVTQLDAYIAKHPNDAHAYSERGYAYGKLGQQDKAISDLDHAIRGAL